jgi:membrane-bound metal-dependent hydrolase YbcI (DUF457 family)
MDWKLHFIFGNLLAIILIFSVFSLGYKISFFDLIVLIIVIQFSSVFPDIDLRKSKIRNVFSLIISLFISLTYMFYFVETWFYGPIYFAILYFLIKYIPSRHRGFTHTFRFSIIFSFLLALLIILLKIAEKEFIFWFITIFLSYNLHLILDEI